MYYYEQLKNNKIGRYTNSAKLAQKYGWTGQSETEPQTTQPEPTVQDKTNSIKFKYEKQITELKDALATATLANDTTSIEELKKEYADLMKKYETELEALNNAEKV